MTQPKIEKIDVYAYPENLGNRIDNEFDPKGNLILGRQPLEYALLDKINEIIEYLNK